ncbi:MAG: Lrp/AsnC family transcriptional regulator [Kordiimonas sp.]
MGLTDLLDKKIVSELCSDAWLTYVELGDRIGLSASATQRRVERLKKTGVIIGATAKLSKQHTNRPLRIFLLLELVSDSKKDLEVLRQQLRGFAGFREAQVTIGATDVVVTLDCEDMEEFQSWSMTVLNGNSNVRHCTTLVNLMDL